MQGFFQIISRLLDIILPRKERTIRAERYSQEDIPVSPAEHDARGYHITTLMEYGEEPVRDLIHTLKYDNSAYAASLLASTLAEFLREEIATIRSFSTLPVILVPVPLHALRQHERGHNQIETILNALPEEFQNGEIAHVAHVLTRSRMTPPQTKLSRRERLTNVEGAFTLTVPNLVSQAHIIVIDDVTTTGSTLTEAARPLQAVAASVRLLALARA